MNKVFFLCTLALLARAVVFQFADVPDAEYVLQSLYILGWTDFILLVALWFYYSQTVGKRRD